MKIKKILISFFFFSNLLLHSSNTKISKAITVLSAISLSTLHNYIVSLHGKKTIVDDLFVGNNEKTFPEEIYNEVFFSIPLVKILTDLYKETASSYSDLNHNNDTKNCNLFIDVLLASFSVQEFIEKINHKKEFPNMEQRAFVGTFSIGVMRGLFYSLLEEQIHDLVKIVPYFKEKKILHALVSSALNIVITKSLLNRILYQSIRYFFVKKNNSKVSFGNGLNEDITIEQKNEETQNEIKITDFIEVANLGTLQAKILIYLIKAVDNLRK